MSSQSKPMFGPRTGRASPEEIEKRDNAIRQFAELPTYRIAEETGLDCKYIRSRMKAMGLKIVASDRARDLKAEAAKRLVEKVRLTKTAEKKCEQRPKELTATPSKEKLWQMREMMNQCETVEQKEIVAHSFQVSYPRAKRLIANLVL